MRRRGKQWEGEIRKIRFFVALWIVLCYDPSLPLWEVERFRTDLQQIFGMLKYKNNKEELHQYIYQNQEYFSSVDVETYQALGEFLHMEKELEKMADVRKGEKVDMCQALKEWYADGVEEGRSEGRAELLKELTDKKRKKGLSFEEIADILEIDVETVRALIEERN